MIRIVTISGNLYLYQLQLYNIVDLFGLLYL